MFQLFVWKKGLSFNLKDNFRNLTYLLICKKINCWTLSLIPYFLDHAGLYCANCLYHPGRISVGEACISYFLMPPPPSPSILYASLWGRARQINEHTISMLSIYVAWEKRCGVLYFDKGNYFLLNTKKKSPPGYWFLRSSNTHSCGCTTQCKNNTQRRIQNKEWTKHLQHKTQTSQSTMRRVRTHSAKYNIGRKNTKQNLQSLEI